MTREELKAHCLKDIVVHYGNQKVTNKEVQKRIKQLGYKGCKNCQHQIAPLRMCKWAEQGGDGRIHFICPRWNEKGAEE